jgi:CRISPR-associated protein Cas6
MNHAAAYLSAASPADVSTAAPADVYAAAPTAAPTDLLADAPADVIDVAYELAGGPLDWHYAAPLRAQLSLLLPWLDAEPCAGIHPLLRTTTSAGRLLLGARSRLVMRVPRARLADCEALQGSRLALPAPLQLGTLHARELLPYRTLYSALVLMGEDDEGAFLGALRTTTDAWQMACQIIVGKAGTRSDRADEIGLRGFSVMLHGLSPAQSLQVQALGLGRARLLGCGLFTPHKSVDPVRA